MRYLIVLLLSGCATGKLVAIDYNYPPPKDWPKLEEKVHYIESRDFEKFCGRVPTFRHAHGCSIVHFGYEVCYIYLTNKDPELLEHEKAHCAGYSHVGQGGRAHQALERWKAHKASQK